MEYPHTNPHIQSKRNAMESWNAVIDFICYGGKAEIQTNDPILCKN